MGLLPKPNRTPRPVINDAHTMGTKKKMSYAFIPFVLGAIILVFSLGTGIEDKTIRLFVLIAGLVLFLIGVLIILFYAKDLRDYANQIWDKQHPEQATEAQKPREKMTWSQAISETKEEREDAKVAASMEMAERIARAEAKRMAEAEKAAQKTE